MSRAHVQGYDTNAAQFERMGNPWVSERERCEFSAPNKRERRQNRNPKKAEDLGNFPKPDYDRAASPAFADMRCGNHFLAMFKAGLPGGTRTVVGVKAAEPGFVEVHRPMRNAEPPRLTSAQLELRREQRAQVQARLEAGEAAYAASEAAIAAEKARLKSIIKAASERLSSL
jgi:hypothetical protein